MANMIRDFRKNEGWTQQELAEKLGVGRESVMRWENGDMPNINVADSMCMLFRCTLYDLFPELKSNCEFKKRLEAEQIKAYMYTIF